MKLAFCLFNYFPYGGLQRDFLRIARICRDRGHDIHVYTMKWNGEEENRFHIHLVQADGLSNHARCSSFAKKVQRQLDQESYDVVIGFNKMPGLDIYYAADVCYQSRTQAKNFIYRLFPRYRSYIALERAVFLQGNPTKILLISEKQQFEYSQYYRTEAQRFHLLPPGISKDRMAPNNKNEKRAAIRNKERIADDEIVLLMVGSGFKTKGLDRAILSLSALPDSIKKQCQLIVVGQDNPHYFKKLAQKKAVASQIHFLGGRLDVADFFLMADILLHPAYHENTGTVLLESLASGLPVLTTDVCGYAHYVELAGAGVVLSSPFRQEKMNFELEKMILSTQKKEWENNALSWSKQADIYSLPERAADFIEEFFSDKNKSK